MENKLRFFLIDYENVHENGLKGYEQLTADDTVIIFCSENANALNGLILANLQIKSIKFQIKNSQTGTKNAMDFQLATEVGRLIGMNHDGHKCIIISSDQGFQSIQQYWKNENVLVSIQPSIHDFLLSTTGQKPSVPVTPAVFKSKAKYPYMQHKEYADAVQELKIDEKLKEIGFNLFQQSKSIKESGPRKQILHRDLCKKLGQQEGSLLYNHIKSLIK